MRKDWLLMAHVRREVMIRALEENASKSADAGKNDGSDDSSDE